MVLSSHVDIEICPNNLAPTNSTTAQLVIGDAIAATLVKIKGFTSNDFAKFHPGGSLGKKLYLKVNDLIDSAIKPMVSTDVLYSTTIGMASFGIITIAATVISMLALKGKRKRV